MCVFGYRSLWRELFGRAVALALVTCGSGQALTGCGPDHECEFNENRCEGNVAYICRLKYSRGDAPRVLAQQRCTEDEVCVLGAQCGGAPGCKKLACAPNQASFCSGNSAVPCCVGEERSVQECTGVCVDAKDPSSGVGFALCALSAAPDPRCPHPGAYCDGDTVVECYFGYAKERRQCESGARCVEDTPLGVGCVR